MNVVGLGRRVFRRGVGQEWGVELGKDRGMMEGRGGWFRCLGVWGRRDGDGLEHR